MHHSVTRLKTAVFVKSGNPNWRRRFSTIDLLIKVAYFVKWVIVLAISKAADLNQEVNCTEPKISYIFNQETLTEEEGPVRLPPN